MKRPVFFAFFVCLVGLSSQLDYNSLVVEYTPYPITEENIRKYSAIIDAAVKRYNPDIIVFPEESLTMEVTDTSLVPHGDERVIPYRNETYVNSPAIRAMSEAAARNHVYLVVNLFEKFYCSNDTDDCPPRGYFLYNTNAAIDREGRVIARYRKSNLFMKNVNRPKLKELSTFKTDFNVTFGMFICFDILFKTPAIDVVREKNIKDVVYSTFWFGELPFLTALQMQVGWAHAMNVNLLAAGANIPYKGSTGSGIYKKGKYKNAFMLEVKTNVLITNEAAEFVDGYEETKLKLKKNPTLDEANAKELNLSRDSFNDRLCNNDLCCRFNVKYRKSGVENVGNYTYKALVYSGMRDFGEGETHWETYCAVVLCSDGNCATKPESGNYPLVFDEMTIAGDFQKKNTFQMPSTLVWNGNVSETMLLDTLEFEKFVFERKPTDKKDIENVSIQLKSKVSNLITFAIYGRKFE